MKFLALAFFMPTLLWANTDYEKNCLKAKKGLEIPAKIEDVNNWSSVESTNGYEEWGTDVKCVKEIEKGKLIVVHIKYWGPFSQDQSSSCNIFDVESGNFTGKVSMGICLK